MKILISLLLSSITIMVNPDTNVSCSADEFVGTWKGNVEYNGSELAQGPYIISLGADQTQLLLKDEVGKEYVLEVVDCVATLTYEEEGMNMTSTYTLENDELLLKSVVSFPDADGNVQEMVMEGSLSKD